MKQFLKWLVRLFVALLLLVTVVVAYLHIQGVPEFLKDFFIAQLQRAGIACQFSAMRMELLRGIVVTDARLADARMPDRPLARIDEVQVQWNWLGLLRRQNALSGLKIANATIAIPTPPDELGAQEFTAANAFATLEFAEDGSIQIEQLTGVYCGIWLQMRGRIQPSATRSTQPLTLEPGKFAFITKILREFNQLRYKMPPQLQMTFDLDLARPLDSQVTAKLRTQALEFHGVNADSLAVDVAMHDGAIQINEAALRLYRGEISVNGIYDIARGTFDLRGASTTDPIALAVVLPPAAAKVVREIHTVQNPKLTVHYTLSPETGILPRLEGRVQTTGLEFRKVQVRSIDFQFTDIGPQLWITNAVITTEEGRLTGHGQFHIESSDFAYELDSTINPCKLLPIMTPVMRHIVEPAWFETAPHIVASVFGDFVDPDAFGYDADVTAQHCSYRGVALKSASGRLHLRRSVLDAADVVLVRPDGEVRGQLRADFNEQRTTFDVQSTANPTPMAALLGDKAAEFMHPYQFGVNNTGQAHGVADFFDPLGTEWTAQVTTEHGRYRNQPVERVSTTLELRQNRLAIRNLELATDTGVTRGNLVADLPRQRIDFDLHTTANPQELAPFIGARAAQIIRPYRFGPHVTAAAHGLIDLTDEAQTTWSAQVADDEFSYWKFTADHGQANLSLTNKVLRLDDVLFHLYDGKLQGRAEFALNSTNEAAYYFEFKLAGADVNKLLSAMRQKPQHVTGILNGQAQFRGRGSDLATLEGSGSIHIRDGVLWEAPLFGILSQILGTTKATDAKTSFSITNKIVKTDDLMIAADPFTAECRGQFSFDGALDYRVKAQFLRSWPGIGWIGRVLGQILEYKVGGTMSNPTYRSVNLPKELLPHEKEKD